jgi:hypothetical protein
VLQAAGLHVEALEEQQRGMLQVNKQQQQQQQQQRV